MRQHETAAVRQRARQSVEERRRIVRLPEAPIVVARPSIGPPHVFACCWPVRGAGVRERRFPLTPAPAMKGGWPSLQVAEVFVERGVSGCSVAPLAWIGGPGRCLPRPAPVVAGCSGPVPSVYQKTLPKNALCRFNEIKPL